MLRSAFAIAKKYYQGLVNQDLPIRCVHVGQLELASADLRSSDAKRQADSIGCFDANSPVGRHPWPSGAAVSYQITKEAQAEINLLYPYLDALYTVMTTSPRMGVRLAAYGFFKSIAVAGRPPYIGFEPFDNEGAAKWWKEHRRDYIPNSKPLAADQTSQRP